MTHVSSGLRKVLEIPWIYNFFQEAIGANQHRRKHFVTFFGQLKDASVLDIGCGTGVLLESLSSSVRYFGIDFEEGYLNYARKKYGAKGVFQAVDLTKSEIQTSWINSFDAINLHSVLHHLDDETVQRVLSHVHQYLKTGGYVVTCDPVFHKNQSRWSRYFVSKDRGQNVKTDAQYLAMAREHFDQIEYHIDEDHAHIPYSMFIMKMVKT